MRSNCSVYLLLKIPVLSLNIWYVLIMESQLNTKYLYM